MALWSAGGIELQPLYVVTSTWKEWRQRHPATQVLSLETGYRRDYREGAAYSDYFATDRLMFNVPTRDDRLPNKAEVLALRTPGAPGEALTVAADFLASLPVYQGRIGTVEFVVLTDASGANRVYESQGVRFADWDRPVTVRDAAGGTWHLAAGRGFAHIGHRQDIEAPARTPRVLVRVACRLSGDPSRPIAHHPGLVCI